MANGVLIGFLNTSQSHLHSFTFVHSLVLPLALLFYPPSDHNFCWRHIFHLDFSFSAFGFLNSSNFAFLSDNLGAYWILPHLTKPLAQSHFCSFTRLAASTPFLSSTRSQLLPPPDCNFCSMGVQLDLFSCCFIFLLCLPS